MPTPLPADDEAAAEKLADLFTEMLRKPGALRLGVMQALGLASTPSTMADRAKAYGRSEDQQFRLEQRAIDKFRLLYGPATSTRRQ